MFSVAARDIIETDIIGVFTADGEVYGPWKDWEPSQISHHGRSCCELIREWVGNTDYSALNGGRPLSGPRWIRERFEWGPGKYPVYWCEVLKKPRLDCGVHAALAHEVFLRRGVRAYRAQFAQEFSGEATAHWRSGCENDGSVTGWIGDYVIYHEGCAVIANEGHIKLWDSSAGWWLDPRTCCGYGSVRAVRIASTRHERFRWERHTLNSNTWTELE